jgi:DNA-binding HxlR family transcriptional regulator
MGVTELTEQVGNVSRSTYFERLRDLEEISLIERRRRADVPPVAACRLTNAGWCLLQIARLLENWLSRAPSGPLVVGDASATIVLKALALGWGSSLFRCLAEQPRSLSELEPLIEGLGYRKLERATRDLVSAGLAERTPTRGRLSRYAMTDWARESVAPVAAAARWERRQIPARSMPVTTAEVETALLVALPLVRLSAGPDGTCLLLVDPEGQSETPTGVETCIKDGRPIWFVPASGSQPRRGTSWLRGTLSAWLHAVLKGEPAKLEAGGDIRLSDALIVGLRDALLVRPASERGRLSELV